MQRARGVWCEGRALEAHEACTYNGAQRAHTARRCAWSKPNTNGRSPNHAAHTHTHRTRHRPPAGAQCTAWHNAHACTPTLPCVHTCDARRCRVVSGVGDDSHHSTQQQHGRWQPGSAHHGVGQWYGPWAAVHHGPAANCCRASSPLLPVDAARTTTHCMPRPMSLRRHTASSMSNLHTPRCVHPPLHLQSSGFFVL